MSNLWESITKRWIVGTYTVRTYTDEPSKSVVVVSWWQFASAVIITWALAAAISHLLSVTGWREFIVDVIVGAIGFKVTELLFTRPGQLDSRAEEPR